MKNIRNLKIFKNKNTKLKLCVLTGSLIMVVASFAGCSNKDTKNIKMSSYSEAMKKTFKAGEHIISVPLDLDYSEGNIQYKYHEGYVPVAIDGESYGRFDGYIDNTIITYVNIEDVECKPTFKNNNMIFIDFGDPIYKKESNANSNSCNEYTKFFDTGEHIISVFSKDDITKKNYQYMYHEGYNLIGMDTISFGQYSGYSKGYCLLYVNNQPVECEVSSVDNDGSCTYADFGNPVELDNEANKTLIKD